MKRRVVLVAVVLVFVAGSVLSAGAGPLRKDVPFQLGQWVELNHKDGPITLHRIRIEKLKDSFSKSALFRPGNTDYLQDIRIVLEYSNRSTNDWDAFLDIAWLDRQKRPIDGYRDEESLNDDESHDARTVTLSTLRYGLDQAKTLRIEIDLSPE